MKVVIGTAKCSRPRLIKCRYRNYVSMGRVVQYYPVSVYSSIEEYNAECLLNGGLEVTTNSSLSFSSDVLKLFRFYETVEGLKPLYRFVPCSSCAVCRTVRSYSISLRSALELEYQKRAPLFVTLTYDDATLPPSRSLRYYDVQCFFKRLRRLLERSGFADVTLKYVVSGEYGSKTYRPHYHIVLFGMPDFASVSSFKFSYSDIDVARRKAYNLNLYKTYIELAWSVLPEKSLSRQFSIVNATVSDNAYFSYRKQYDRKLIGRIDVQYSAHDTSKYVSKYVSKGCSFARPISRNSYKLFIDSLLIENMDDVYFHFANLFDSDPLFEAFVRKNFTNFNTLLADNILNKTIRSCSIVNNSIVRSPFVRCSLNLGVRYLDEIEEFSTCDSMILNLHLPFQQKVVYLDSYFIEKKYPSISKFSAKNLDEIDFLTIFVADKRIRDIVIKEKGNEYYNFIDGISSKLVPLSSCSDYLITDIDKSPRYREVETRLRKKYRLQHDILSNNVDYELLSLVVSSLIEFNTQLREYIKTIFRIRQQSVFQTCPYSIQKTELSRMKYENEIKEKVL